MMNGRSIWLFGAAAALLCACTAHHEPLTGDGRTDLDQWVDDELVPYTVKELSSHPKFKGQPFLIVSMRGDTADASIDDLSKHIRQRMVDALLTTPGVKLVWPAASRPWQHFGQMTDIPCGEFQRERYYVGLDVALSPVDAALEVSVRALDLVENNWVAGFHHSWRGYPTEAQNEALARRHPDENLRGLRASPFDGTEPDLLAAYLAHNLRCRLRHSAGAEETVIYAEHGELKGHSFFHRTFALVSNYMSRFREARITDVPAQATVTLSSEIHPIHEDLYQVWVGLRDRQSGQHLPGSETEAYVRLEAPAITAQDDAPARPVKLASARSTLPRSPSLQDDAPYSKGRWMGELGRPAAPAPPAFGVRRVTDGLHRPMANGGDAPSLIGSLRLVTPVPGTSCEADLPRGGDSRIVMPKEQLPEDACVGMEVAIQRPARMFVLGQSSSGRINWIFPEPCRGGYEIGTPVQQGEVFRFRLSDRSQPLHLRGGSVDTWVYVIAIADRGEWEMRWTMSRLVDAEPLGLCASSRSHALRPGGWQRHLDALRTESGGKLEWRAIHFPSNDQRLTHL